MKAMKNNDTMAVKRLVNSGIDINGKDENGANLLMHAMKDHNVLLYEWTTFLHRLGASNVEKAHVNRGSQYLGSLLAFASHDFNLDVLKYLVDTMKCDPNKREYNPKSKENSGWTAIEYATYYGSRNNYDYLISKGADPNSPYSIALCLSISEGRWGIFKDLIGRKVFLDGLDYESSGNNGPIHKAIGQDVKYLITLVEAGANINLTNGRERTALELAVARKNWKSVYYLRSKKASLKGIDISKLNEDQRASIGPDYEDFFLKKMLELPEKASKRDWLSSYYISDQLRKLGKTKASNDLRLSLEEFGTKYIEEDFAEQDSNRFLIATHFVETKNVEKAINALALYVDKESDVFENPNYQRALELLVELDKVNQAARKKTLDSYLSLIEARKDQLTEEANSVTFKLDSTADNTLEVEKILRLLDEKTRISFVKEKGLKLEAQANVKYEAGEYWLEVWGKLGFGGPYQVEEFDQIADQLLSQLKYNNWSITLRSRSEKVGNSRLYYKLDKERYKI